MDIILDILAGLRIALNPWPLCHIFLHYDALKKLKNVCLLSVLAAILQWGLRAGWLAPAMWVTAATSTRSPNAAPVSQASPGLHGLVQTLPALTANSFIVFWQVPLWLASMVLVVRWGQHIAQPASRAKDVSSWRKGLMGASVVGTLGGVIYRALAMLILQLSIAVLTWLFWPSAGHWYALLANAADWRVLFSVRFGWYSVCALFTLGVSALVWGFSVVNVVWSAAGLTASECMRAADARWSRVIGIGLPVAVLTLLANEWLGFFASEVVYNVSASVLLAQCSLRTVSWLLPDPYGLAKFGYAMPGATRRPDKDIPLLEHGSAVPLHIPSAPIFSVIQPMVDSLAGQLAVLVDYLNSVTSP